MGGGGGRGEERLCEVRTIHYTVVFPIGIFSVGIGGKTTL